MTPIPLYIQKLDGFVKSHVFYCSNCRIVGQNQEYVEKCCKCYVCNEEVKNDDFKTGDRRGGYAYHAKCQQLDFEVKQLQREKTQFENAQKIDIKDYNGRWVYLEGTGNEGFSESIDELLDDYLNNYDFTKDCPDCGNELKVKDSKEKDYLSYLECQYSGCSWISPEYEVIDDIFYLFAPDYVWACEEIPFTSVNLDTVMENISDNGYEDILDHVKGKKELQLAIDEFNETNKDLVSYRPDYKIAIVGLKEYVKENWNK